MTLPRRGISAPARRAVLLAKRYAVAVPGLAYALTLGLRKSRHRGLVAQVARHFGFVGAIEGTLPLADYDLVADPETPVVIPAVLSRPGNVSDAELILMARLVATRRPRSILEIGTFDGRTTVALAANAPADATVTTLDLPPTSQSTLPIDARDQAFINKGASGERFSQSPHASRIRQVYGDSATYEFGPLAVDFAFIDGSHSYEYALSDSRRVRAMMRQGRGVIVWHDYGGEWEGVTQVLNELAGTTEFRGLRAVRGTTLAILDLGH